jgi:hypothetical protein
LTLDKPRFTETLPERCDNARGCHPRIEQSRPFQHPLDKSRRKRKTDPDQEIASGEPAGSGEWLARRLRLPTQAGVDENQWCR